MGNVARLSPALCNSSETGTERFLVYQTHFGYSQCLHLRRVKERVGLEIVPGSKDCCCLPY